MNNTLRLNWHKNTVQEDFKVVREDTSDIALSTDDILRLKAVELTGIQDTIRDRFIVGIYTGLRVSDWAKFEEKARINNDGIFTIVNQKTGKKVSVSLSKEYYLALQKYNGKLPKQYNSILVNRNIKLIALKAGLTDKILLKKAKGGKLVHDWVEKWRKISTHTGRRTAVSELLTAGVNTINVGSMMGMTAQTIKRYDKRSSQHVPAEHKHNPFFN